jgi:hypothetical protein
MLYPNAGAADAEAVDAHALVLFMFAQVYVRRHNAATQQPALDVWPQQSAPAEAAPAEPGSPKARTNHTGQKDTLIQSLQRCVSCTAKGVHRCWPVVTATPLAVPNMQMHACAAHFLQQRSNAVVRKELAAHLGQQQALLAGYLEFLQRSASQLLALCLSKPPSEAPLEGLMISASEVDRAGLLLAPLPGERGEEGGSPMDATPTPFTGTTTLPVMLRKGDIEMLLALAEG